MRVQVVLVIGALMAAGCFGQPDAPQAPSWESWTEGALAFLAASQRADGGHGEGDAASDYTTTLWVALAGHRHSPQAPWLAAADAFLAREAAVLLSDSGTLSQSNRAALAMLYAVEAGEDPDDFYGANLSQVLREHQELDGGIGGLLNQRLVGAGALASAFGAQDAFAVEACDAVSNDLASGWDSVPEDAWFAAQGIQVLLVCGVSKGDVRVTQARNLLVERTTAEGGVRSSPTSEPDASTTANAAMALAAFDHTLRWGWEDFMQSMQRPDGAVRFSLATPDPLVKTTAEALLAFDGSLY